LASAVEKNTHLQVLLIANCSVGTECAKKYAEILKHNKSLTQLNMETNRIEKDGIVAIADALKVNSTLKELWLTNQYSPMGNQAESALAQSLENNNSIVRLSATMRDTGSRNTLDRCISRNKETARKARVGQSK